MMSQQ